MYIFLNNDSVVILTQCILGRGDSKLLVSTVVLPCDSQRHNQAWLSVIFTEATTFLRKSDDSATN